MMLKMFVYDFMPGFHVMKAVIEKCVVFGHIVACD